MFLVALLVIQVVESEDTDLKELDDDDFEAEVKFSEDSTIGNSLYTPATFTNM